MDSISIHQIPLFAALPEEEVAALLAIAQTGEYTPGQVIFFENQPSDSFLVILDGQVEVVKAIGSVDERSLGVVKPGEYLGEVGIFMTNQVRSASVRALILTRTLEIPRVDFQALLERQPSLAFHLMQEMSQRLRSSEDATIHDLRLKNWALQQAYEELQAAQAQLLAKERLEAELATARKIQQTLLPREMPLMPGWQAAAIWQPAREVSGDFYDFLEFPDGELGVIIGDVTGKGVPAALVMAITRSHLRAAVHHALDHGRVSPGRLLAQVNELLIPDMPALMFVTCLVAALNLTSGKVVFANAGHCLPYQRSQQSICELRAAGMPLGLMPGMSYPEYSTEIEPGQSLVLYSDGLIEAHNAAGEMFGQRRLQARLGPSEGGAILQGDALIADLLAALNEFSGAPSEPEDDVTLVTIQRA